MKTDVDEDEQPLELPIVTHKTKHSKFNSNHAQPQQNAGPRDPRFDPKCSGSNERRHFVRNYAFLDEVKKSELDLLQKAAKKEQDPDKRNKIKMAISRFRNKMIVSDQQLNPKKPRGKFKKLELADKFMQLKESGKLTKYLERKRKKNIKRDMKLH